MKPQVNRTTARARPASVWRLSRQTDAGRKGGLLANLGLRLARSKLANLAPGYMLPLLRSYHMQLSRSATASDSPTGLVSHRYLATAEPPALILTLLAAEQRQHIAWGATSRATASVRETPGKQNNRASSTCVCLAAKPPNRRRSKGGIACEPGAAACSLKARKPGPRLYAATAPQLSHAIVKIGVNRILV